MHIVKPLQLSLIHKSFTYQKTNMISVGVLLPFNLSTSDIILEQNMWEIIAEEIGDEIFDFGMPKSRGEVLVAGDFIAPSNREVEAGEVKLQLSSPKGASLVKKELAIFGDRYWYKVMGIGITPSKPEKFSRLNVSYKNAFGGANYDLNPVGKGVDIVKTDFGERQYLPNIEYKSQLLTSPSKKVEPASLGRVDIMWKRRLNLAGTYNQEYIDKVMPGLADDIDWEYFNDAPSDQRLEGYFNGYEYYSITNMNEKWNELSGQLPDIHARVFVNQEVRCDASTNISSRIEFKEINTKLETLWLFPNSDLGVMIYRGTLQTSCNMASDIKSILLSCEGRNDNPRTVEHYERQLEKRLDPKNGFKYMLFSQPLIAEKMTCGYEQLKENFDFPFEMLGSNNMESYVDNVLQEDEKKVEKLKQNIIEQCKLAGIDPSFYLQQLTSKEKTKEQEYLESLFERMAPGIISDPKNIDIFNVDFSVMDEIKKYQQEIAEKATQESIAELKEEVDKLKELSSNQEVDQLVKEIEFKISESESPPMYPRTESSAILESIESQIAQYTAQLNNFREQGVSEDSLPKVDDDVYKLKQDLTIAEEQFKNTYLLGAHLFGEARSPHPEKEQSLKEEVISKYASKDDLTNRDFACIDLSGQDLTGIDLSGCYLEGVNFSDCNLSNANLSGAIAAGANFSGAILTNANCKGANIGATDLTNTILNGSDLTDCQLGGARFKDTQIENCILPKGNYLDTTFENVSFRNSDLSESNFINPVFKNCHFEQANLTQTNYVEGQFVDCDYSSATLDGANFVKAQIENGKFNNAQMINVRFVGGCDILGADFSGANVSKSCLRENKLNHAIFEHCVLDEADFSGAELIGASFKNAKAYRTQFMLSHISSANFENTNLMEGSMYKAYAVGAKFDKANLYSVNFMDATLGDNSYKGANLDQTILKEWRP